MLRKVLRVSLEQRGDNVGDAVNLPADFLRFAGQKGLTDNLSESYQDNLVLNYAGFHESDLNDAPKTQLLGLIAGFVGNMDAGHAKVRMSEVEKHCDETRFGWIGNSAADGVFYHRIHSLVILIEFDHERPIALARSMTPTRNHIHTVVRTPNGNDYGNDLLRQHLDQHPHK